MKKTILVCGLIGGLISISWYILSEQVFTNHMSMNARLFCGYATMILGFSLIFVAVKNYRDNYNHGVITFMRGLRIGLLITLVASTIYVIVWMVDFTWFIPDVMDSYKKSMIAELKAHGAGASVIAKKSLEMDDYIRLYRNPFYNALVTYREIVPVGLVISAIAALILKKKPIEATPVIG